MHPACPAARGRQLPQPGGTRSCGQAVTRGNQTSILSVRGESSPEDAATGKKKDKGQETKERRRRRRGGRGGGGRARKTWREDIVFLFGLGGVRLRSAYAPCEKRRRRAADMIRRRGALGALAKPSRLVRGRLQLEQQRWRRRVSCVREERVCRLRVQHNHALLRLQGGEQRCGPSVRRLGMDLVL